MKKAFLIAALLLSTAYASELDIGAKLYRDGLFSLAAKTFRENLSSLKGEEFKKYYKYAYLSFLKEGDLKSLKELLTYWEENYPNFSWGELLALQTYLKLKEGAPVEKAFPLEELKLLPIEEKVNFFKTLSGLKLGSEELLYILNVASKNPELKGAIRESGFLKKALSRAVKENNYTLIDFIFDNYGRWFSTKEEKLQFIRYLERKKRFADALVEAKKLYKQFQSDDVKLELARIYYLSGKYDKVLKLIKNPTTDEERYLLAWSYFKLGKPEKIPALIGLSVEKPRIPRKLATLYSFYTANFNLPALKELYPELYTKALIFSFGRGGEEEVGLAHDRAFLFYETGFFQRAKEELEKALQSPVKDDNLNARTLFLLGKLGTLNTDVGTVIYNQLLSGYDGTPYYAESILDAAKVYLYSSSPDVAIKLLTYAKSQLGKKGEELRFLLGEAYKIKGNYKKASDYLAGVNSRLALTELAYALYKSGDRERAQRVLKELFKRGALFPEANGGRLVFLSKALGKEKELRDFRFGVVIPETMAAVITKDVKRAQELLPKAPIRERQILDLFLATYYEEKNPQKAFVYLSELFNISNDEEISAFAKQYMNYLAFKTKNFEPLLFNDPHFIAYNPENGITSTSTLISKASDYASAGQYGKAYGLLKLALERNTSDTLRREIVRRLVNLDLSQGNTSRALKDISLLPKNSQEDKDLANYLLFKTYLKAGKLVDAYEAARKVSSLENVPEEERSSFLAKLARYYKLTGKGEEALKLIRELIKSGNLSQVDYDDLVSLALLAQQKGELPLAQRLIVEAVKKAKTKTQKAESLFFKASIEAQLGRVDEAILDYLKIAYEYKGLEPWSSTSLYNAAQLFEEKGKYEEALKLYKKVAELKRGTKEGEVAAKKVKSLLQKIGEEE